MSKSFIYNGQPKQSKFNYKPLINVLEPYKIIPGEIYSFTLNLSDQYDTIDQSQMAYKYFLKKYVIEHNIKFELYPDLSRKARYHMHGIIIFQEYEDITKFYVNVIQELNKHTICGMEIDTISNTEVWYKYCLKSQNLFRGYDLKYTHLHQCIRKATAVHLKDQFSQSFDDPLEYGIVVPDS